MTMTNVVNDHDLTSIRGFCPRATFLSKYFVNIRKFILISRVVQAMAAMDPTWNPRAWTMKPSRDKITNILIWSRRTPKPRVWRQDTVTKCYWVRAAAAFHGTKQPLHLQVKRHQQRLRPLLSRPALPSAPSTRTTTTGAKAYPTILVR